MNLLTAREAAAYLRHGRTFVFEHADDLGAIRAPGELLFDQASLDAWLERQRVTPPEPARKLTPLRQAASRFGRGPINPVTGQAWDAPTAAPPARGARRGQG